MIQTLEQLYAEIDTIDPVQYAKTRNHLNGAVTKLSPYITRGVVTLPDIRDRLLERHSKKDCEKLIQELAWREYFQSVWWAREDDIFSDLRFERDDWRHASLVSALVSADTGVEVIDSAIAELYQTGYMHNHARMWVASVACNLAKAHWYEMGRWLYYHLIDGDPASNFLSWQWVAGTSKRVPYTVNQKLINACSDVKQVRSILTYDRDLMLEQELPAVLEAQAFSNFATTYPNVDVVQPLAQQHVVLYTPWTLDPLFCQHTAGARRVLVIDPEWFDRLPVHQNVMDFIVGQGKAVMPALEVFIGHVDDVPGIQEALTVTARAHQTNLTWSSVSTLEPAPKLFPAVSGYYKSFFAYWKQVEKSYR